MALELRQNLKLTQQLVMTPQLQQAIKLLQLSRLELIETIQQEMETNPILEDIAIGTESTNKESSEENVIPTLSSVPENQKTPWEEKAVAEQDWKDIYDEDRKVAIKSYSFEEKEDVNYENFISKAPDLIDHLLWQLRLSLLSDRELHIGEFIIGNINPEGYLDATNEELLDKTSATPEEIEKVLGIIHYFDPVGIGARDLKECLFIQAKHYGGYTPLIIDIINNYLHDIEKNNYAVIVKNTKATPKELEDAIHFIKSLDPKPGRNYSNDQVNYIVPDLYVYKQDNEYVISFNEEGIPNLGLSKYYKMIVENNELKNDAKVYLKDKMKSAEWLIKSIQQRKNTLFKITKSIMKFQRDFLEKGVEYMHPLVLRDVAEDVELHESTVSRSTTNKYVHTPRGIFELKYFFSTGIKSKNGSDVSAETVKQRIKILIQNEKPEKPLKDTDIEKILAEKDVIIARRTIAKYREQMGILPTSRRKKPKL
jgi:RNA polymerase sigma-54 factor